jgi:hypothetical protein
MARCRTCGGSSSNRVGSTVNTAIIFGEDNRIVYRARITGDVPGMQTGAVKYVTGTGVQDLVDDGLIMIIAGSERKLAPKATGYVLYYVGDVGFPTLDGARVHSAYTGLDIVERSF